MAAHTIVVDVMLKPEVLDPLCVRLICGTFGSTFSLPHSAGTG